ncbi:hypothetical protein BDV93DRAFT_48597 [Ceratobasidium sp. AG-I]|nr:hypothetical protein BDV93DRAFT_48597 [Ceratobasidium sp. AG-I]
MLEGRSLPRAARREKDRTKEALTRQDKRHRQDSTRQQNRDKTKEKEKERNSYETKMLMIVIARSDTHSMQRCAKSWGQQKPGDAGRGGVSHTKSIRSLARVLG